MLWWFAAEGMCEWYALLAAELAPYLEPGAERSGDGRGEAQALLSEISAPLFARRHALLEARFESVPVPGDGSTGQLMGALYRSASNADAVDRSACAEHAGLRRARRAERWLASMTQRDSLGGGDLSIGEMIIASRGRGARAARARSAGELCSRRSPLR